MIPIDGSVGIYMAKQTIDFRISIYRLVALLTQGRWNGLSDQGGRKLRNCLQVPLNCHTGGQNLTQHLDEFLDDLAGLREELRAWRVDDGYAQRLC